MENTMNTEILIVSRGIRAMGQFTALVDDPTFDLWFSYGENIPQLHDDFLFWGAGKFALGLKRLDPKRHFSSPGADWLSKIPLEFSSREIVSESFSDAISHLPEQVWFKLAELKHDLVSPRAYSRNDLINLSDSLPELGETQVQWTTSQLRLNFEHRFFIVDGEPLTGSPYLVDGLVDFSRNEAWRRFDEALGFAKLAARELAHMSPRAYTLDVALNEDSNEWLIVEGNRSWSSGLYGSDVKLALESIRVSLGSDDDWQWEPDSVVYNYASKIKITADPENATGLLRFES